MSLVAARCLDDPQALWLELQSLWSDGQLVALAPPQEQLALREAVLGPGAAGHAGAATWRELGPALVLGSGGSSGGRRWCLQPLAHLQASAAACGDWLAAQGIEPERCLHLDALPLHHVSGLMPLLRAQRWGAELRWLPPELLRQCEQLPQTCPLPARRPVLLSLVPTQLQRLLQSPAATAWLADCTVIWVGGAALSAELAEQARAAALPLAPCYGATETAAMVCALPPARFLAGEEGCGPLLSDVELRLEGAEQAIALRSARLSPGWFEAGRLLPFCDADGWWRSGDAGVWRFRDPPAADAPRTPRQAGQDRWRPAAPMMPEGREGDRASAQAGPAAGSGLLPPEPAMEPGSARRGPAWPDAAAAPEAEASLPRALEAAAGTTTAAGTATTPGTAVPVGPEKTPGTEQTAGTTETLDTAKTLDTARTVVGGESVAGASLVIHGRLDGAIHSGGETVFPEQVRQRLLELIRQAQLPVAELLLLGERDPLWGERLVALVRWAAPGYASDSSASPVNDAHQGRQAERLARLEALSRCLPPAQRPRRWLPCPDLEASAAGKWDRRRWLTWVTRHAGGQDDAGGSRG